MCINRGSLLHFQEYFFCGTCDAAVAVCSYLHVSLWWEREVIFSFLVCVFFLVEVRVSHWSQLLGRLKLNTFIMFCFHGSRLDTIRWNFNKVWGGKNEVITSTKAGKTEDEYESTHTSNKSGQIYTFSNENDCAALRGDRENKGLSSKGRLSWALEHPTTPYVMGNWRFFLWNKFFCISHKGPRA